MMSLQDDTTDFRREGLSVPEACRVAGIGRTTLYAALSSGALPARKLGRRIIILRSDLTDYLAGLPTFGGQRAS